MPAGLSQMTQSKRLAQLFDHALDAFVGQRVLVAGLRGGEQIEGLHPLVADQRLLQLRVALRDIDEVVDDAALGAEHEIEIAQPDVEIDHADPIAAFGERGADRSGRGRLADASLARGNDDDLAHWVISPLQFRMRILTRSPSRLASAAWPSTRASISSAVM